MIRNALLSNIFGVELLLMTSTFPVMAVVVTVCRFRYVFFDVATVLYVFVFFLSCLWPLRYCHFCFVQSLLAYFVHVLCSFYTNRNIFAYADPVAIATESRSSPWICRPINTCMRFKPLRSVSTIWQIVVFTCVGPVAAVYTVVYGVANFHPRSCTICYQPRPTTTGSVVSPRHLTIQVMSYCLFIFTNCFIHRTELW